MADQEVVQKVKMLQQNPQLVNGMMQDQKMMQVSFLTFHNFSHTLLAAYHLFAWYQRQCGYS